jgi:hypothetical protein
MSFYLIHIEDDIQRHMLAEADGQGNPEYSQAEKGNRKP